MAPRTSPLRRYAPVLVIVVALAIAGGIAVVASGNSGNGSGSKPAAGRTAAGSGPLTYAEAKQQGKAGGIDWGPNCDTTTGRVRLPTIYAAPCVEPWDAAKGNGGATAPGVTGDTIKIAVYQPKADDIGASIIRGAGANDTPEQVAATRDGLLQAFSRVYETYGRKVEFVTVTASGTGNDDAAAKADAIKVATDVKPFLAWGGPAQSSAYGEELASHGIVCLGGCSGPVNDTFVREHAPLVWTTGGGSTGAVNQAEWLAKRVAHRNAEFAGAPDLQARPRRFALVNYDTPEGVFKESVAFYRKELAKRGVKLASNVTYFLDTSRLQENARTIVAKLRDADVTTVIFAGDPLTPITLTKEATAQGWFPEWIVTGIALDDTNFFARQYDPEQWAHAFGAVIGPVRVPQEQFEGFTLYQWAHGEPPPARSTAVLIEPAVLQIMNGIHLAGPKLSAETFRDGLFRYPPSGGGPTQPRVSWGFHGGATEADYSPFDDATEIWFDPTARGKDEIGLEGKGLYRWSDGGQRYQVGEWPKRPTRAFQVDGSVTGYPTRPPEDRAPDYPPPSR